MIKRLWNCNNLIMYIMKRYNSLVMVAVILLLTALVSSRALANDSKMTVWLKDGTKTDVLFTGNPSFVYDGTTLTLTSDKGSQSWSLADLRKLTFNYNAKQAVEVVTEDGETITSNVEVHAANDNEEEKTVVVTSASATESESGGDEVAVALPSEVVINGESYKVTEIAENTFAGKTEVTDIYLPISEEPVKLGKDALKISDTQVATVHSSLSLLAQYSLNEQLKQHVADDKLKATVKAPNHYWSFSCGVDVIIPDNIKVYKCIIEDNKVKISMIDEKLLTVEGKRIIKKNNGVLVACPDDDTVNAYDIIAKPKDGDVIAADKIAKDYGENWLVPVIEAKNYPAGQYYVLKDNEFHEILDNDSKVPVGKAVLKKPAGVSATRTLSISNGDGSTNITPVEKDEYSSEWYNLNGQRRDKPTTKGVYINNGKKVIIK